MPELPDVTVYVERLKAVAGDQLLRDIRLASPFLLRSVEPPLEAVKNQRLIEVTRLGKRIVMRFEQGPLLVLHLMVAGRIRWKPPEARLPKGNGLAAFDFETGCLILTEAGKRKRASLHVVADGQSLALFARGGLEVMGASFEDFDAALRTENHTLKRALTDPRIFSGIGNAYSDEILHAARLSPFKQTSRLAAGEARALFDAVRDVLAYWTKALRDEVGEGFPDKVTAFREGMAVHGRYKLPCPRCASPVQRIKYAENEANYCARCQTGGRLLADRSLSRLLKRNWPKRIDELERP